MLSSHSYTSFTYKSITIKEGSALPRQSPTLPRGLEGGHPLCVKIFLGKSLSTRTSFMLFDYFKSGGHREPSQSQLSQ
jgi:hypothetical protein